MKQLISIVLLVISISSCRYWDKKDFELSREESDLFSSFRVGDTIYYRSDKNDVDTITVVGIREMQVDNTRSTSARATSDRWVLIKYLPVNSWHGMVAAGDDNSGITSQRLLTVSKDLMMKQTSYQICFKEFTSAVDTVLGTHHADRITLNGFTFNDYYVVDLPHVDRVTDSTFITRIYWTAMYGLTAYQDKSGQVWTRVRHRD